MQQQAVFSQDEDLKPKQLRTGTRELPTSAQTRDEAGEHQDDGNGDVRNNDGDDDDDIDDDGYRQEDDRHKAIHDGRNVHELEERKAERLCDYEHGESYNDDDRCQGMI